MIKKIHYADYADRAVEVLSKGAFLSTSADGEKNTMTIGWGAIGFMWGKPIFTVMVRKSRHTHTLLEKNPEFTVSVPLGDMKRAVGICGAKSGRDTDKFSAAGLAAMPGRTVASPAIEGAGLHFECKVVFRHEMRREELNEDLAVKWYAGDDWHTLYYGEITDAYIEE